MADDREIKEKRQGKLSATTDILGGKAGRKVFVGVWVIVFANLWFGLTICRHAGIGLSERGYLILSLAGVLLIGFGTIMDTFVAELGHRVVDVLGAFASARVGVIANKIDKVEVKSDAAPAA